MPRTVALAEDKALYLVRKLQKRIASDLFGHCPSPFVMSIYTDV